jgi:hypothetical protein
MSVHVSIQGDLNALNLSAIPNEIQVFWNSCLSEQYLVEHFNSEWAHFTSSYSGSKTLFLSYLVSRAYMFPWPSSILSQLQQVCAKLRDGEYNAAQ